MNKQDKIDFIRTALSKGITEARKTLPPQVVRYIHRGGRVYDENGNDITGKEIPESKHPTITIHRKIIG